MHSRGNSSLKESIALLSSKHLSPLDLLPHNDFHEKCIDLVLNNVPANIDQNTSTYFNELRHHLVESRVDESKVVVFGGGTGLSNIIGGDSRLKRWANEPFQGLKAVFPRTHSIVCVTDDGGSTGELMKDLPLIALGDIRHVLLSSIQLDLLQSKYSLSFDGAQKIVGVLSSIFNKRFVAGEINKKRIKELVENNRRDMPEELANYLDNLIENLFSDDRFRDTLARPQCLGNLLLAAAIYSHTEPSQNNEDLEIDRKSINEAIYTGLTSLAENLGANRRAVLPCTTTPAQLRLCYTNGVEATGECKSGTAVRGYPVDRVIVDFSDEVLVHKQIFHDIADADIIILAPGSLYSSIIPIFQVPGIAEAVRGNKKALKLLISNLWVQAGETDISISDPERKFHVSDMIRAYERNIPGGTADLFQEVLCLSLKDVPASILQNYALEDKIPIYLDKKIVCKQGFRPIECTIYSKKSLSDRGVIQHDPELVAHAVKTIFLSGQLVDDKIEANDKYLAGSVFDDPLFEARKTTYPSSKYRQLKKLIHNLPVSFLSVTKHKGLEKEIRQNIVELIWKHQDIPLSHLQYIQGIVSIDKKKWGREQVWDKVFSFYDPSDNLIKIRSDQLSSARNLEIAILIALGQSLLGNYAESKYVEDVVVDNLVVGKIYHLKVRQGNKLRCYFSSQELDQYLKYARMYQPDRAIPQYTRLINGREGFTPPGVLMGLTYAWYLDNRLASHIEYKMALMKISKSDLIPEQLKMLARRDSLIHFFRDVVFAV